MANMKHDLDGKNRNDREETRDHNGTWLEMEHTVNPRENDQKIPKKRSVLLNITLEESKVDETLVTAKK